jgi:hypothetical protein
MSPGFTGALVESRELRSGYIRRRLASARVEAIEALSRVPNAEGASRLRSKWQMPGGNRRMENGKRQTANGKRQMANGEWKPTNGTRTEGCGFTLILLVAAVVRFCEFFTTRNSPCP